MNESLVSVERIVEHPKQEIVDAIAAVTAFLDLVAKK